MALHIPSAEERQAAIGDTICLRKLHDRIGFDIVERRRRLQGFYEKVGFSPEAVWIRNRAAFIQKGDGS